MIVLIGGTLMILLVTALVVVVIRRMKGRSKSGSRPSSGSDQGFLWPQPSSQQPWSSRDTSSTKEVHPQLGSDYAEVFHHSNPMSSFVVQPTSAYASTTLIRNSSSLPFHYQSSARSVHHIDPSYSLASARKSNQSLVPNWVEMLPPPPQHPPPPLTTPERMSNSNSSSNNNNTLRTDFPSFITSTLPSTIHTPALAGHAAGVPFPLRASFSAHSQPALMSQIARHSRYHGNQQQLLLQQQQQQSEQALYATCAYDGIENYPLSSYR